MLNWFLIRVYFILITFWKFVGRSLVLKNLLQKGLRVGKIRRRRRLRILTCPNVLPLLSLSSCKGLLMYMLLVVFWFYFLGFLLIGFVWYRDDFRKTFKEANPDSKDVKRVMKTCLLELCVCSPCLRTEYWSYCFFLIP